MKKIFRVIGYWALGLIGYIFISGGLSLLWYAISPQAGGISLQYGTPIFIFLHFIFSIMYVWKNKAVFIKIMIGFFILYNVILFVPWNTCGTFGKGIDITSCTCIGDIKTRIFDTQCIGIRTQCFEHLDKEMKNKYDTPKEVSCN